MRIDCSIVRELQVKEGVLERIRASITAIYTECHPSGVKIPN